MLKSEGLPIVRKIENVIEYESLSDVAKARVDKQVEELRNADATQLLTFGTEAQASVTEYAGEMIVQMNSNKDFSGIDDIIEELLDVTKPFIETPIRKNFLQRIFSRNGEKKFNQVEFAGKVNVLVDAIETQIGGLIEENIMYDSYIELLLKNISSVSETILALERYKEEVESYNEFKEKSSDIDFSLENTDRSNLLERLKRKIEMCRISRHESMQVAVSSRMIQNTNVILSDKLQTLLVIGVPILQNQILLKTSLADTQRGLDTCDSVAKSISKATKENIEQLKGISKRLSASDELPLDGESVVDMSKLLLEMADDLKSTNDDTRQKLEQMNAELDKSDEGLSKLFESLSQK